MSNIDFIISNNIDVFKADVLKDFSVTLLGEIAKTYLGEKYIKGDKIKEHFVYSFNTSLKRFADCQINIPFNFSLYSYFFNFFDDNFYSVPKHDKLLKEIENKMFFLNIHMINSQKDKDKFIEAYKLFN